MKLPLIQINKLNRRTNNNIGFLTTLALNIAKLLNNAKKLKPKKPRRPPFANRNMTKESGNFQLGTNENILEKMLSF